MAMLEELIKYLNSPEEPTAPFILEGSKPEDSLEILVKAIQELDPNWGPASKV